MVIQRIQSLYLLLAALVLGTLCFFIPVGVIVDSAAVSHQFVYAKDCPSVLPLVLGTAVLMFADIFLYKRLRVQIRVAGLCVALTVAIACAGSFVLYTHMPKDVHVMWFFPALVLAIALILVVAARRNMMHDYRLLKSYERIR